VAHKYTKVQAEFIRENVVGIGNVELTKMFNKHFNLDLKVSQIKAFKTNRKLSSGLNGRFSKGHVPANKGVKGVIYDGCKKTWFKKGNKPVNHKPIGSERINVEGYTEIKVAEPNRWRLKHRIIWEEHNGPIPKNHNVIFGDGDKSNLDINNLVLVSKKQLLTLNRNNLIQNDADLTKTAVIIADLYNKIGERKAKCKG
jgi:hypothetical protein